MRFCVSGRQPYSVLNKADEIKVTYADRDRIFDFIEKLPTKTIILDVPGQESDWNNWQLYNEKFDHFYIALHDLNRAGEFNHNNIKWYWPYPITTYYELSMIINVHPSYIMLGPPLSFDLDNVAKHLYDPCDLEKQHPIPVRMTVNVAHSMYLPINGNHGICGQWVRPEDTEIYSTRVQCFEFEQVDLKQEELLLHIYKDNQTWPGNLNLLIQQLNFNVDNRAIPEDFGTRRMNCKQKCWSGGQCALCVRNIEFAELIRKEKSNNSNKVDNEIKI